MMKIDRGDEPPFLAAARNAELVKARKYIVEDGNAEGFKFTAYKGVKGVLNDVLGGKCAYCESYYDATSPVDVEHHRPKGAIQTANGRSTPGYWWMAAVWSNLLPSCIRCNREETQPMHDGTSMKVGKGELFPLLDEGDRATAEDGEGDEIALLIDPSVDDPVDYLNFELVDDASIARCIDMSELSLAGRRARSSIDVYGLNRQGLVRSRTRYVLRARTSLRKLKLSIAELERMRSTGQPTAFVETCIDDEIALLKGLTDGEDGYTGTLKRLILPELDAIGIDLRT